MARCGDCNKFVSTEPEVSGNDFQINDDELTVTADVDLNCTECGGAVLSGSYEISEAIEEFDDKEHDGEGHDLDASCEDESVEEVSETKRRTMVEYRSTWTVTCSCGKGGPDGKGEWTVEVVERKDKSEFEEA